MAAPAFADSGWDCTDPDIVFCDDMTDTSGIVMRDQSRTGFDITLNGGPARVLRQPAYMVAFATTTVSNMPSRFLNFTRTVGEDGTSQIDSTGKLEFSGKPLMVCVTFFPDSFVSGERSVFSYSNDVNGVCGWHFRISGAQSLVFGYIGISDNDFNRNISDLNPHSYCAWTDGVNILTLFIDKIRTNRFSAAGTFATCNLLSPLLKIARRDNLGHAEFGGGVSYLRIKKNVTSEIRAFNLAGSYVDMVNGRNLQSQ